MADAVNVNEMYREVDELLKAAGRSDEYSITLSVWNHRRDNGSAAVEWSVWLNSTKTLLRATTPERVFAKLRDELAMAPTMPTPPTVIVPETVA